MNSNRYVMRTAENLKRHMLIFVSVDGKIRSSSFTKKETPRLALFIQRASITRFRKFFLNVSKHVIEKNMLIIAVRPLNVAINILTAGKVLMLLTIFADTYKDKKKLSWSIHFPPNTRTLEPFRVLPRSFMASSMRLTT